MLGLDEAEACFGESMTGEACRSVVPVKYDRMTYLAKRECAWLM